MELLQMKIFDLFLEPDIFTPYILDMLCDMLLRSIK